MPLSIELAELLMGFEKRMKFINIVRMLLEYPYPDEIKNMLPDKKLIDNIILAVLVYIKERTLGAEQTCKLKDIEHFLEDFSVILPKVCKINAGILAKYIIVEVLQNGGALTEFLTFDSVSQSFIKMPIRLLNEERGSYHLTDDAFDFLFRSKEIESELDYSVTRFRMKEYMKRDNYAEALEASRELVSRIRSMKISMDDFLLRCRENISRVTVDVYDGVISKTRSLLETEYKELEEIQKSAKERKQKLEKAYQSGVAGPEIQKRYSALREIINNISLTIEEQRILINKKSSLAKSYEELIRSQFTVNRYERLNFENDIMIPLQKSFEALNNAACYLLFPLAKPLLERRFSIENFYAPQSKINEADKEQKIDINTEETNLQKQIEIRSQRYLEIIRSFFCFAAGKESFTIQSFVESLRLSELISSCTENALPNVLLSLFAMQKLNIEAWRQSERLVVMPNGEFELAWCLNNLPEELLNIKALEFEKLNSSFGFSADIGEKRHNIKMSNFEVKVIV